MVHIQQEDKRQDNSNIKHLKPSGCYVSPGFAAFYGTRRFISALTTAPPHLICPCPEPDRFSPCPHSTSRRSSLIFSFHLRLGRPTAHFPSGFPTKTLWSIYKVFILSSIFRLSLPIAILLLVWATVD